MPQDNLNPVTNTKVLKEQNQICNGVKSVIEALLFASERPLTLEQLKDVLDNFQTSEIRKILEGLSHEFQAANRGIRIIEVAGGFQMITAPNFSPFLKKLYKQRHIERLSKPALETLAIVAYRQPVTRLQIESIRNVNIDGMMRNLLDKDLIRVCGRKKAPGRPKLYGTTRQFLEHFGLKSLEELPKVDILATPEATKGEGKNEPEESALQN